MPINKMLEQLNDKQQEAVKHIDGPLLIIAGAGSGKTRVITYRAAYLVSCGVPAENILAVTFTNKAAEEMRLRVNKLVKEMADFRLQAVPLISTFHSFCVRVLKQDIERLGYKRNFVIYDDDDSLRLIKQCLKELKMDEKVIKPREALGLIAKAKDNLLDSESYQIYASASRNLTRLTAGEIYRLYQRKLKENNALDFGDLIMLTVQLWQEQSDILKRYQDRFPYLMIDEYQDTNHAQYIMSKMLAQKNKNICVVGDEDQSIYMFRGADIRNILDFEKDYRSCVVIKLEQNYRSTGHILEAAHKVITNNQQRKGKKLWTDNKNGEPVCFRQLNDEIEEANFVAWEINQLMAQGILPREIAVFYRTNAQSRVLEDAFRRVQLRYAIIGGMRFYERKEVKDILAYLRVIANTADSLNLKRIVNVPNRGIGEKSVELVEDFAKENNYSLYEAFKVVDKIAALQDRAKSKIKMFLRQLSTWQQDKDVLTLSELTAKIIQESGYLVELDDGTLEAEDRVGNVKELLSAVKEFEEQSEDKTVGAYLEQVALFSNIDTWKEEKNYVTLMTLHLAKGLEFNHVFMVGLEEGLLPHVNSLVSEIEIEEERRLCYVGITRAKHKLVLSCAAERRLNGTRRWHVPSRFIVEAELRESKAEEEILDSSCQIIAKEEKRAENSFSRNQLIVHEVFGEGRIVEVSGFGDEQKVVVDFAFSGRKRLMAKLANLKLL